MDVIEKLVELLTEFYGVDPMYHGVDANALADHLIAHGVTVQDSKGVEIDQFNGWVSVKDRLPEKNTSVLASTDNGIVFQCLYAYDGWDLREGHEVNITHWQPMPQPPKGE